MVVSQGFPPEARIRKGGEFALVLRKGVKRSNRYFTLHILAAGSGRTRLGIVASRRVGGAVRRNRAKRLLREAFRRACDSLPAGLDLVAVAKGPIAGASLDDVERAFRGAVRSAGS